MKACYIQEQPNNRKSKIMDNIHSDYVLMIMIFKGLMIYLITTINAYRSLDCKAQNKHIIKKVDSSI